MEKNIMDKVHQTEVAIFWCDCWYLFKKKKLNFMYVGSFWAIVVKDYSLGWCYCYCNA